MRPTIHALLLAGLFLASPLHAAVSDPNWTETVFSTDGSQHTGLAWAPDGSDRLFVLEKTGREGQRGVRPIGLGLIALGILMLAEPATLSWILGS